MTLKDAWEKVKSRRPVARPNHRFSQALLSWERDMHGENSITAEKLSARSPRRRNVEKKAKTALDRLNDSSSSDTGRSCSIL